MKTNGTTSFGESTAEYITRVMAGRGFIPTNAYSATYIEFAKTYADAQGRIARAVVQFERPGANPFGEARLSGFNVVVQAHIEASIDAVEERSPPVMREDLVDIVQAFEQDRPPPAAVALEQCSGCPARVSEFFVVKGRVLCRECKGAG